MSTTVLRYYHTIRYLKPIQIICRLKNRFFRSRPQPCQLPLREYDRQGWIAPVRKRTSCLGGGRFIFLNKTAEILDNEDWNKPGSDKLWLYNLHYFDFLGQDNPPDGKWLDRWISENPPGHGNGWEPYPISLRTINWIKYYLNGHDLTRSQLASLAHQIQWLSRNLEYHLLANHLWANGKALVFGGVFFDGDIADEWLNKGIDILEKEIKEQILADGGHFERSPMYHAIILEDILDLINLNRCLDNPRIGKLPLSETAGKMLRWLSGMCHPDGEIAFFNDAATGIAATPRQLYDYAASLDIACAGEPETGFLPDSGFFRIIGGDLTVIGNIGAITPAYQPGHAHADTLSFEMSFQHRRVLVNSGTSCYRDVEKRWQQRATSAHNTLTVDGVNSSEVWSSHRVAMRARIVSRSCNHAAVVAAHDGFSRAIPGCLHTREWRISDNRLEVDDLITGNNVHQVAAHWHFHPEIRTVIESSRVILSLAGETIGSMGVPSGWRVRTMPSRYAVEFGKESDNTTITVEYDGKLPVRLKTLFEFGVLAE